MRWDIGWGGEGHPVQVTLLCWLAQLLEVGVDTCGKEEAEIGL